MESCAAHAHAYCNSMHTHFPLDKVIDFVIQKGVSFFTRKSQTAPLNREAIFFAMEPYKTAVQRMEEDRTNTIQTVETKKKTKW